MLLTEDEAKTKWCPFARHAIDDSAVFPVGNRFGSSEVNNAQCRCLGSACMAWRWADPEYEVRWITPTAVRPDDEKPEGDGWVLGQRIDSQTDRVRSVWHRVSRRPGYCGLAGKVEP